MSGPVFFSADKKSDKKEEVGRGGEKQKRGKNLRDLLLGDFFGPFCFRISILFEEIQVDSTLQFAQNYNNLF